MSAVLDFYGQLEVHDCPNCSMRFAAPPRFIKERREDGKSFYCPAGHSMSFHESEVDRLKRQLEAEKRSVEWQKGRAQRAEKSLIAQKGQMTKLKNRIAKGVCPCCRRSFKDMARHMKTKHPNYTGDN